MPAVMVKSNGITTLYRWVELEQMIIVAGMNYDTYLPIIYFVYRTYLRE